MAQHPCRQVRGENGAVMVIMLSNTKQARHEKQALPCSFREREHVGSVVAKSVHFVQTSQLGGLYIPCSLYMVKETVYKPYAFCMVTNHKLPGWLVARLMNMNPWDVCR